MKKKNMTTQKLVYLSLTVAAMVAGGWFIYLLAVTLPLPGFKYLTMTPYLSFITTFVILYFKDKNSFFYVNTCFSLIMSLINIYMGITIFTVGVITQVAIYTLPRTLKVRPYLVALVYSESVIFTSIYASAVVLKLPLYDGLKVYHLLLVASLAAITSFFGGFMAQVVVKRLPKKIL